MYILFFMILCHIIDDFVLQPICLANLKQRKWWGDTVIKCDWQRQLYKNDYLAALVIHSLSWSIMIHIPIMLSFIVNDWVLLISIIVNAVIHFIVDDLKANKYKINLVIDQSIHMVQVILTFIILLIVL